MLWGWVQRRRKRKWSWRQTKRYSYFSTGFTQFINLTDHLLIFEYPWIKNIKAQIISVSLFEFGSTLSLVSLYIHILKYFMLNGQEIYRGTFILKSSDNQKDRELLQISFEKPISKLRARLSQLKSYLWNLFRVSGYECRNSLRKNLPTFSKVHQCIKFLQNDEIYKTLTQFWLDIFFECHFLVQAYCILKMHLISGANYTIIFQLLSL